MYADDTQIYIEVTPITETDVSQKINNCLTDLKTWMTNNYLKINPSKTQMLVLSPKRSKECPVVEIVFDGTKVEPSQSVKTLGVILDSKITFDNMINDICRSCYFHLRNLGRIKRSLDKDIRTQIINNLVSSKIDYCNSLFSLCPAYRLNKLQKIQNAAARLIHDAKRRDSASKLLKSHFLPV